MLVVTVKNRKKNSIEASTLRPPSGQRQLHRDDELDDEPGNADYEGPRKRQSARHLTLLRNRCHSWPSVPPVAAMRPACGPSIQRAIGPDLRRVATRFDDELGQAADIAARHRQDARGVPLCPRSVRATEPGP